MGKLTKSQVEHIAKLARIELSEKEKEKYIKQLSSILDYVEKLNEVETEKVEPIAHITGLFNILREDKVAASTPRKKLLENAPDKKEGYLKVKAVLE